MKKIFNYIKRNIVIFIKYHKLILLHSFSVVTGDGASASGDAPIFKAKCSAGVTSKCPRHPRLRVEDREEMKKRERQRKKE